MIDNEVSATHVSGRFTQVKLEDPLGKKVILGSGGEGTVKRVIAKVERNGKTRQVNLVHKVFENPADIKKHMEVYRELQKFGLPVPDTFRETDDGILMTDLSDNGRNLILSYNDLNRKRLYHLKQKAPELFERFDHLDLTQANQSMQGVIEKASQNGVNFDNVDSWTFIMKPDGSYSFVLNDLLNVKLRNTVSPALRDSNQRSLETFTLMLTGSQDNSDTTRDTLSYWASK